MLKRISLILLILWALYCPNGHFAFYTYTPVDSNQAVYAKDWYYAYDGHQPVGGEKAQCSECNSKMIFSFNYLYPMILL